MEVLDYQYASVAAWTRAGTSIECIIDEDGTVLSVISIETLRTHFPDARKQSTPEPVIFKVAHTGKEYKTSLSVSIPIVLRDEDGNDAEFKAFTVLVDAKGFGGKIALGKDFFRSHALIVRKKDKENAYDHLLKGSRRFRIDFHGSRADARA